VLLCCSAPCFISFCPTLSIKKYSNVKITNVKNKQLKFGAFSAFVGRPMGRPILNEDELTQAKNHGLWWV
jgi:hypothetical protein